MNDNFFLETCGLNCRTVIHFLTDFHYKNNGKILKLFTIIRKFCSRANFANTLYKDNEKNRRIISLSELQFIMKKPKPRNKLQQNILTAFTS